ncbi:MAG TPA: efflux RND transporter permease subunit [Burkholderiaceae bacterium]|nr:efflux RND transporter permease subunit [Burkholderiaceae bacterium]
MTTSAPPPLGISGRLARAFLASRLTPLLAILGLLLGLFAVAITPKEEEPQINVTMANVFIPFPAASTEDVHNLITVPAEQVLSQISGIDHVFSVTRPGLAILTVQFKVGEDRIAALVRLHDTMMANHDWAPSHLGVGEPIVKPKGIDDVPIVTLTLHGTRADATAAQLQKVAHALEIELKRVSGTREVQTYGGPDEVVRVTLDPERLAAHHITVTDIEHALRATNASAPSGQLLGGSRTVEVRTGEFFSNADDVAQLIVGVHDRLPVYLADVARVTAGADVPVRFAWHTEVTRDDQGATTYTEYPAVTIAVSKKPGENASTVADALRARVAQLQGTVIPDDTRVVVTRNYGDTARDKANKLIQKLVFATLSVVALAWMALGRREAIVVGAAVVLTLATTLFASWAWGFTLNRVSLFALIFSIGILVDDAIVVVENIHRRASFDPEPLAGMIPRAVDEVGGPTIVATLTVIAAVLPMAFVGGLIGPYMAPIPIISSMGMLLSLLVAFIVTPWLALRLLHRHRAPAQPVAASADKLSLLLARFFTRVMTPFLQGDAGRRNRMRLGLAIVGAIGLSVLLAPLKLVVLKMLPFDNKSEFQVVVDMPTGSAVEATAAVLHDLSAEIAKVPEVMHMQAYAGLASPINFNGLVRQYYLRSGGEVGDIQVNLTGKHQRDRCSHDIAQDVARRLAPIARRYRANVKVVEVPPGPPVLSPIVAEIYGPDYASQVKLARAVRQVFESTPDLIAVDDSTQDAAERVVLRVDAVKAALYGIPVSDVARTARLALAGEDITPLHDGQSKYAVPVRMALAPERMGRLDDVLKLRLRGTDDKGRTYEVALAELVQPVRLPAETVIYRKDLQPVVYVVGDVAGGPGKTDSPLYGMFAMRSSIKERAAAEGIPLEEHFIAQPQDRYRTFGLKWDGEWQITYETFRDMGIAYAVGLLLIYLLVVAQFRSYLTPLIIMAPIPLTIIGVLPGHALLHSQFTATSMIGMIALAGIIVRNSILLVDFIHHRLAAGATFEQATIDAAATRAKPIVLTAVAAMLGALFILDDPIFNGLAISLLFGIFVSTLLTLLVIPVLYYAVNRHAPMPARDDALATDAPLPNPQS